MITTCDWTPTSNKSKFKIYTDSEMGKAVDIKVVEKDPEYKDLTDKELIELTKIEGQKLAIQAQLEEAKISGEFDVKLNNEGLPVVETTDPNLKFFLKEKTYNAIDQK